MEEKIGKKVSISRKKRKVLKKLMDRIDESTRANLAHIDHLRDTELDSPLFYCRHCGERIRRGEKYFVNDGAIARYNIEQGAVVETKEKAWTINVLCMDCYTGREETAIVKDYDREGVKNPL